MLLVSILFWLSIILLGYTFAGYPLLVWLLGHVSRSKRDNASRSPAYLPPVTVALVVRNEAERIKDRLSNLFESDYPAERINVAVYSDGSNDDTVRNLASFDAGNVIVKQDSEAHGKAHGLNAILKEVPEGVVVFTDARQSFEKDTIRKLVAAFADLKVGAVSGELEIKGEADAVSSGVDSYWRLERFLRKAESQLDSCIGCTGAVYAIRRNLAVDLPEDTILDDVVMPMHIAVKGYRVLFNHGAKAYDPQRFSPDKEKKRKRRTLCGNFQMLFRYPEWLLPWRNRLWWQLISHKYMRLISPVLLLMAFVTNVFLIDTAFYRLILFGQIACYVSAFLGITGLLPGKIFSIPAGFLFLNMQVVQGFLDYIRGTYKRGW